MSALARELVLELAGTEEASRALTQRAKPGGVMLVKGSQSSRMERVAKALTEAAEGHLRAWVATP
jgi:UDP-N-acetylmuramyl pentapeptide synthase